MAKYTYYFCDLLTNALVDELPLYGVYFDLNLNKAGTLTGTIRLDWPYRTPRRILDATQSGRTAVYIDRDGVLVWGGIIWSRTYESDGRSAQIYAETFDSYAKVRVNLIDRLYTNIDQRNIARGAWTAMQTDANGNIGMTIPGAFPTDVPRTLQLNGFEQNYWGDIIDNLLTLDNGFDTYVQVQYLAGVPSKTLLLGWPRLGQIASNSGLTFEFPGAIQKFWFPENASNAATQLHTIGKGDGAATLQGHYTDVVQLTSGYPLIEKQLSLKDFGTQALLNARTISEGLKRRVPITVPTILVYANRDPIFGSYGLGDDVQIVINDVRFPEGLTNVWRIVGWKVSPSSADAPDEITLVLQGQEDVL